MKNRLWLEETCSSVEKLLNYSVNIILFCSEERNEKEDIHVVSLSTTLNAEEKHHSMGNNSQHAQHYKIHKVGSTPIQLVTQATVSITTPTKHNSLRAPLTPWGRNAPGTFNRRYGAPVLGINALIRHITSINSFRILTT